jgi:DNA-binding CsgD family transcriptional regulator
LLVAAARAEAAWLEGASGQRISSETDHVVEPDRNGVSWFPGEIACWRWRAGLPVANASGLAEPYRLEISGDAPAAARWWRQRRYPYQEALALSVSASEAAPLRRALDALLGLGARPAAAIVTRRLHGLGERGVPRGPRPGTSANPAGLTERESQVVGLLADGLTNTEIAAQLVVSGRTVDHHVAAILRKLGVPSRAEAIIEAVRLGLASPGELRESS